MFTANRALSAKRAQNFAMQLSERHIRRVAAAAFHLQTVTE